MRNTLNKAKTVISSFRERKGEHYQSYRNILSFTLFFVGVFALAYSLKGLMHIILFFAGLICLHRGYIHVDSNQISAFLDRINTKLKQRKQQASYQEKNRDREIKPSFNIQANKGLNK